MEDSKAKQPFLSSYAEECQDEEIEAADLDLEKASESSTARRTTVQCVLYFLLVVGWLLAITLWVRTAPVQTADRKSHLPASVFKTVKRSFQMDGRYVGPSEEANDHWEALIAAHDVLYMTEQEQRDYNLPPGMPSPYYHPNRPSPPPQDFYVLSIMHQMHCLNHIRAHYWQIKTGGPSTPQYTEKKWNVHVNHCFEYLRQSVLCGNAIFEIEGYTPLFVPDEGVATTVSGWGVEHECVDYDAISRFQIDRERQYNRTWF
ncbi:hypothetical protein BO82DRAFT_331034 [Aspergillus uvarum CBS 121591]|uniref:Tat pathway signal sequence n=1 Tax=Aspergillus uvarum CBS 121591 TaxID=1448315 RepID=A0A319CDP4_9EURO|nr:hypothetical protein BO82DRAFT_331034 [Aspergillus uvarum CBS 121591]PYH83785.1 hypothetical protein BO82DRAFT_331034 [Aspergillus uvarum CBS 121591]